MTKIIYWSNCVRMKPYNIHTHIHVHRYSMSVSHAVCCSYREWGSPLIGNTHELRLELVAAVFVPLHTCVRVCAHFLNVCEPKNNNLKKSKRVKKLLFLFLPFLLLLLLLFVSLCLGDFHSITSFFLCELDSFYFLLFSFALPCCYFRAFATYVRSLSVWQRLMRLRARTFLSILLLFLLLPFDFAARRI